MMAYIRRPYRGSVTVDVDVDINDILNDLDDDTLIEELRCRGRKEAPFLKKQQDLLDDLFYGLRLALSAGDRDEALALLDAYQRPRWSSPELCEKDYQEAMRRPSPGAADE